MRRPTDEQIATATLWLRSNEGSELASCEAVADWLLHQAREANLKAAAREAGVSMRNVRKYVKQIAEKSNAVK